MTAIDKGPPPSSASEYVVFSDWRDVPPVDYATNPACAEHYSGHMPKGMRRADQRGFHRALIDGDTLVVGADYYALFALSAGYFPNEFLMLYRPKLAGGDVIVLRAYRDSVGITWELAR